MKKEIFLDHASTTPVAKQVLQEVIKSVKNYGNPSSKHELGENAKEIIEKARADVAKFVDCNSKEIFFTSGGTEGNNFVLKGLASKYPNKKHILVSSIEHHSITDSCDYLAEKGFSIEKIRVDKGGILDLEDLKRKIREDTLLVSVMHVNNEIGTIQPIEKIAEICKEKKVFFHSDMVQSLAKLDINLTKIGLDFAVFSGHKINALKGIGFVFVRNGIEIDPLVHGGHQERGLRSGTENFAGIVSLASAIKLKRNKKKIKQDRDELLKEILKIPGTRLNGSLAKRIYNNIHVSFYGIEGESLMMLLSQKGIYVSTGSACSSNTLAESHVLKAIGAEPMYINGSIRVTIDSLSSEEKKYFISCLKESVYKLEKISPFKYTLTKSKEAK